MAPNLASLFEGMASSTQRSNKLVYIDFAKLVRGNARHAPPKRPATKTVPIVPPTCSRTLRGATSGAYAIAKLNLITRQSEEHSPILETIPFVIPKRSIIRQKAMSLLNQGSERVSPTASTKTLHLTNKMMKMILLNEKRTSRLG